MVAMPMYSISSDKLGAMRQSWEAQAAARALAIKKLRERVAFGKSTEGIFFTPDEVGIALALVSEFYLIEGRVKMLEELQADLERGPSAPPGQSGPAHGRAQGTRGGNAWRLP